MKAFTTNILTISLLILDLLCGFLHIGVELRANQSVHIEKLRHTAVRATHLADCKSAFLYVRYALFVAGLAHTSERICESLHLGNCDLYGRNLHV